MSAIQKEEVRRSLLRIKEIAYDRDHTFFIGLQEARNTESNSDIQGFVRTIFKNSSTDFLVCDGISYHDLGVALISRDKPSKVLKLELPKLSGQIWKTLFRLKSGVPQYGAIISQHNVGGKMITVVILHLDVFGGVKQKSAQVEVIKHALKQFDAEYCVIMGDFNTGNAKTIRKLFGKEFTLWGKEEESTVSIKKAINPEIPGSKIIQKVASFTGMDISFRSDWILTKNLRPVFERVEYSCQGSDHFPVWAVLDFKS